MMSSYSHNPRSQHIVFLLLFCILLFHKGAFASVSANVPISHWSYAEIDKLIGRGLIDSSLAGSRPFSRLEMARLIGEALTNYEKHQPGAGLITAKSVMLSPAPPSGEMDYITSYTVKNKITTQLLSRLKEEFTDELVKLKYIEGNTADSFFKPLEDPYFRFVYGDKRFELENRQGDVFSPFANYRLGISSRAKLWGIFSCYLHPELKYQKHGAEREIGEEWEADLKVIEGYLKLDIMNLEIELGRDSLWWGPGRHGSLLMSSNSEAFDMLKISNPKPILLPWLFKYLGPFKFVTFLTELEEDRAVPEARLWGLRLNFKPHPILELGLSRTIMLGGEGRESLDFGDYWKVFTAGEENETGKLNNNQLAGIDFSLRVPRVDKLLPLVRSITLYGDIAGEDEAGGGPSHEAYLGGVYLGDFLLTGRCDLRVEYANNHISGYPDLWYNHGVYTTGYSYENRIIGHHMGSDADDLLLELTHYITPDLLLGLAFDRERRGLSSTVKQTKSYGELSLSFWGPNYIELKGGYRYEHIKNFNHDPGNNQENHIIILEVGYNF